MTLIIYYSELPRLMRIQGNIQSIMNFEIVTVSCKKTGKHRVKNISRSAMFL